MIGNLGYITRDRFGAPDMEDIVNIRDSRSEFIFRSDRVAKAIPLGVSGTGCKALSTFSGHVYMCICCTDIRFRPAFTCEGIKAR